MLHKTRGIVLRTIKYSETSVICTVFTEELGLRKYIVNGVRSTRAQVKPALLQPMSLLDMVVYQRENKELNRIGEIRPAYVYSGLPFDIVRGAVGMFIAEVAQKTIKEADPNPNLFGYLFDLFYALDTAPIADVPNFPLIFMATYAAHLGIQPGGEWSALTPYFDIREGIFMQMKPDRLYIEGDEVQLFSTLCDTNFEASSSLSMTNAQRRYLLQHWLLYYRYHLEHLPEIHTPDILQEIFR